MIRVRSMFLAALALVVLAGTAHAQFGSMMGGEGTHLFSFGVGGGLSVPVNDAKDAFKNGFNGLAYARVSPSANSDTRFGVNGGAGVTFKLGRIALYVQGRVDNIYTSDGGVIDTKSIQVIPVTLGVEF